MGIGVGIGAAIRAGIRAGIRSRSEVGLQNGAGEVLPE